MDPNLSKIKDVNMYAITHGKVRGVISQAEDYLTYIIGHNQKKVNQELNKFICDIKAVRKQSRST